MRFNQAALADDRSPPSVNSYWRQLRSILRRIGPATDKNPWGLGIISRVPAMRPVRVDFRRPRRVTHEELSRLYIHLRHAKKPKRPQPGVYWQCLLVTAYFTGLRVSDLLKIRWEDINTKDQTLYVLVQKTRVETDLPIHPVLMEHFKRLQPCGETLFDLDRRYFFQEFAKLCNDAGVDFRLHDVRRTACSEIDSIDRGMGKVLLLHAPRDVTERSYLNALPELRGAIEKMPVPLAFKHGIKMTERYIKKARQSLDPGDFTIPIHPPAGTFHFTAHGFFFRGKLHRVRGNVLGILKTLVENDCSASQQALWTATDTRPFPRLAADRKRLYCRITEAQVTLRKLLGLPDEFNPIVAVFPVRKQALARYELFLPPGLWEDE